MSLKVSRVYRSDESKGYADNVSNTATSTSILSSTQRKTDEYGARAVSRGEHVSSPSSTTAGAPNSTGSNRTADCYRIFSPSSGRKRIVTREAIWVSIVEQAPRTTDKHSGRCSSSSPTSGAHVSRNERECELAETFDVANTSARTDIELSPCGTKSSVNACSFHADISPVSIVISG